MASAAIIQISALGGRELVAPVAIRGGLSPETIECLQRDIARSFEESTELKPRINKKTQP